MEIGGNRDRPVISGLRRIRGFSLVLCHRKKHFITSSRSRRFRTCEGCRNKKDVGWDLIPSSQRPYILTGFLGLRHVRGLQALGALDQIELDGGAFRKRAKARALDRGIVDENVLAILAGDEAEALGVVEPLHVSSRSHAVNLLSVLPIGESPARQITNVRSGNRTGCRRI